VGAIRRVGRAQPPLEAYPEAVVAGPLIFTTAWIGWDPARGLVRAYRHVPAAAGKMATGYAAVDAVEGPKAAQAWYVYSLASERLRSLGSSVDQMVRAHIYQRDKRFFPIFESVRLVFEPGAAVPSSGIGVTDLPGGSEAWWSFDAIALVLGAAPGYGGRRILTAPGALPSASFYSQGVGAGPYFFLAGHIPIKTAEPGKPVVMGYDDVPPEGRFLQRGRSHPDSRDGPIAAQTWFTYREIQRLIEAQGATMGDILNVTVYLQDMRDFPTFHRVHERFFPEAPPAVTVTGFGEVGHRGTRVEIEVTALDPAHGLRREVLASARRGARFMAASPGVKAGSLVFLSGLLGRTADDQPMQGPADLSPDGAEAVRRLVPPGPAIRAAAQAWGGFIEMRDILAQAGGSLGDLARLTVYLADLGDFPAVDRVVRAFLGDALPVLSVVQVPGPGPLPEFRVCLEPIVWTG
jgi:enamine deaminase RidA (YjgF/YER057c/UK114 family)